VARNPHNAPNVAVLPTKPKRQTIMTKKEELWEAYATKNPSFNGDGEVTMTAAGLRKFFNQTFDHGFDAGKGAAEALAAMMRKNAPDEGDIFSKFFKR
jgi:hypothetical protein